MERISLFSNQQPTCLARIIFFKPRDAIAQFALTKGERKHFPRDGNFLVSPFAAKFIRIKDKLLGNTIHGLHYIISI